MGLCRWRGWSRCSAAAGEEAGGRLREAAVGVTGGALRAWLRPRYRVRLEWRDGEVREAKTSAYPLQPRPCPRLHLCLPTPHGHVHPWQLPRPRLCPSPRPAHRSTLARIVAPRPHRPCTLSQLSPPSLFQPKRSKRHKRRLGAAPDNTIVPSEPPCSHSVLFPVFAGYAPFTQPVLL